MWQTLCFACFLAGANQALLLLQKPAVEKHFSVSPQLPVAAVLATLPVGLLQKTLLFQGASETRLQEELHFHPVGPSVLCEPLWP